MKKLSLLILALILVFVSCQQDHIFYDISQEIQLDKPSIGGKVVSIKKAENSLYAINGMLNYKSLEEKRWTKVETPVEEISSVAVGNGKIYILSGNTVYAANLDEDGKVSSSWESYKEGISRLFDNQAGTVYIVKEEKLYKIGEETEITVTLADGAEAKNVVTALSLGGVDYFFGTTACAVSENNFYFANEGEIKYGNGSGSLNTDSTDSTLTSMTILDKNLYIGTDSGAFVAKISDNGALSSFKELSDNAESSFGGREVLGIWKFDDGDNFFVSVTSASSSLYDALWGYDSSLNKWNLE